MMVWEGTGRLALTNLALCSDFPLTGGRQEQDLRRLLPVTSCC